MISVKKIEPKVRQLSGSLSLPAPFLNFNSLMAHSILAGEAHKENEEPELGQDLRVKVAEPPEERVEAY